METIPGSESADTECPQIIVGKIAQYKERLAEHVSLDGDFPDIGLYIDTHAKIALFEAIQSRGGRVLDESELREFHQAFMASEVITDLQTYLAARGGSVDELQVWKKISGANEIAENYIKTGGQGLEHAWT